MRVTVGSGTESNLGLRFDNWSKVGGGGSIASTSNMQVNNANTIVGAVPAATTYGSPLALGADLDPGMPGVQQDVYVWLKVPAATVGGAYSTSYGVMSSM